MIEFVTAWAESTWQMLVESALLFMVGLLLAGLIWLFINERMVSRYLGRDSLGSVLRAALIGIPLPLCSCSVLPVATQLRKGGASKAGVTSFLIATPESGADSILLTYSLTDPLLTVARPLVAFLAAITAGVSEHIFSKKDSLEASVESPPAAAACCDCSTELPVSESWPKRLWSGVHYAFTDLLKDLAPYLLFGFVLAGLIGAFLDSGLLILPEAVREGWYGYLGAVIIGLPMYICASSSTPLAAILLAAGFSPGAILVFLLVGPATNAASLVVVKRILGLASTVRYLLAIVLVALAGGFAIDYVYDLIGLKPDYGATEAHTASLVYSLSAILLSGFIIYFASLDMIRRVKSFLLK